MSNWCPRYNCHVKSSAEYENKPVPEIFECDDALSWGLHWDELEGKHPDICLVAEYLGSDARVTMTPSNGNDVLEMEVVDPSKVLLLVKEGSGDVALTYGLLMPSKTLSRRLCKDVDDKGFVLLKSEPDASTVHRMWMTLSKHRAGIDDQLARLVRVSAPTPKTPPKKRKARAVKGAPLDVVESGEEPDKKKRRKSEGPLTLGDAVHLKSTNRESLSTEKQLAIRRLYEAEFNPVYIFGGIPFQSDPDSGKEMLVDIAKLYRAPPAKIVYRSLIEERVKALLAQKRLMPSFQMGRQHLYLLPLKGRPMNMEGKREDYPPATFFELTPMRNEITAETCFYIIGGQHNVEAHRRLIAEGCLSKPDAEAAAQFKFTLVWAPPSKHDTLMHLSRVLNQDIAGNRTESTFLGQLGTARRKWKDMGSPQPALHGHKHSKEYLV